MENSKVVPRSEDSASGVQVIARAAAILRSLKNEEAGLSLGQIADRVGLPRSTVQRIVGALQAEHLVIAAAPGRGIRLGPELASLAESARLDIGEIVRPYLVELAKICGETVDLAVLRGKRVIFIDQIPGVHRLRTVSSVGDSFPLFDTANGKACLAMMTTDAVRRLMSSDPEMADPERASDLMAELVAVRRTRLAYDLDEHNEGISAVGVAFRDRQGDIYAISIPTPSARFAGKKDDLASVLMNTLDTLEKLEVIDPMSRVTPDGVVDRSKGLPYGTNVS